MTSAPLLSSDDLKETVSRLADDLVKTLRPKNEKDITLVAIMDGAILFAADLLKALYVRGYNVGFETITLKSYGDSESSSGIVKTYYDSLKKESINGKTVILVDDIYETGLTMSKAVEILKSNPFNAFEVLLVVLGSKNLKTPVDLLSGKQFGPEAFLVGYGLDYDGGRYRGQPYISVGGQ